ncbi:sensor histidine kinase [Microbacterium sp. C5A9]|uniref:sensor histidine kinase n=1 Tax=Microbacterium sp. C5A9 TaxID=2736663 RepID=UPI001F5269D6|nr:histidine kinase [Microbacterium sp. C5A9]MCI1019271.1 sensor histidine kinase [Microbacterium sp. C5A9]
MRSPTDAAAAPRSITRDAVRMLGGTAAGIAMLVPTLIAVVTAPRRPAPAVVRSVAARLTWIDGIPRRTPPRAPRLRGLLALSALLQLVVLCILILIGAGIVVGVQMLVAAATGGPVALFSARPGRVTWTTVGLFVIPGLVLLFLALSGIGGIAWLERRVWQSFQRPGAGELSQEVVRLHTTLDEVVDAVDAERRRIERDIHDGVQQRVVALSILLARVERAAPDEARRLLSGARDETQHVLDDLRDVAWRTYPEMLQRDGLAVALEALRDRVAMPVTLEVEGPVVADRAAETAAYFVASEAVTNAIKHARASAISIRVRTGPDSLTMTVEDDGVGGADAAGTGLSGIASRVAARDGRLHVHSPAGGPTVIEAVIPCG